MEAGLLESQTLGVQNMLSFQMAIFPMCSVLERSRRQQSGLSPPTH